MPSNNQILPVPPSSVLRPFVPPSSALPRSLPPLAPVAASSRFVHRLSLRFQLRLVCCGGGLGLRSQRPRRPGVRARTPRERTPRAGRSRRRGRLRYGRACGTADTSQRGRDSIPPLYRPQFSKYFFVVIEQLVRQAAQFRCGSFRHDARTRV